MSNTLTIKELEAVLAVAGYADAPETLSSCFSEDAYLSWDKAFENGMQKLRRQLANRDRGQK